MMSGIRGADTKPELAVRKALHARGFRYRLHLSSLPGKSDIVLSRYNAVVLVHGCFWHQHGCTNSKRPKTREAFWNSKLTDNVKRDRLNVDRLRAVGWRVATVWECSIRNAERLNVESLYDSLASWLVGGQGSVVEL
jgi:DNA mismatch endonuclease, patch repair protein